MMAAQVKSFVLFATLLLLLCTCFCSESPRSKRQKRGIMKMMMHIMWDPVRLIRYWYAYDVTKEIAKSWRKIIPTIMLLPISSQLPASYGIAKYIHPTIGVKDTEYHKNIKKFQYPDVPVRGESYLSPAFSNDYYHRLMQQSEQDSKRIATPPENVHAFPQKQMILHGSPAIYQQHINTGIDDDDNAQRFMYLSSGAYDENKNTEQAIIQKIHHPFQDDLSNKLHFPQHSNIKSPVRDIIIKPVPIPYEVAERIHLNPMSSSEIKGHNVVFQSSSDHKDISKNHFNHNLKRNNVRDQGVHLAAHQQFSVSNSAKQNHLQFLPDGLSYAIDDQTEQQNSNAEQEGSQEVHIVLHPIPVSNFNTVHAPYSSQSQIDGQSIHIIPFNLHSNHSVEGNFRHVPFLIKATDVNLGSITPQEHSSASIESNEELSVTNKAYKHKALILLSKNESITNTTITEKSNTSSSSEINSKQTPRITWISGQNAKPTTYEDNKNFDLASDGTIVRISSVQKNGGNNNYELHNHNLNSENHKSFHTAPYPLQINGHTIDLVQLREDLKHGTPVLIPFNKNTFTSDMQKKFISDENQTEKSQESHLDAINPPDGVLVNQQKHGNEEKILHELLSSAEKISGSNSSQKLMLFLTKKKVN